MAAEAARHHLTTQPSNHLTTHPSSRATASTSVLNVVCAALACMQANALFVQDEGTVMRGAPTYPFLLPHSPCIGSRSPATPPPPCHFLCQRHTQPYTPKHSPTCRKRSRGNATGSAARGAWMVARSGAPAEPSPTTCMQGSMAVKSNGTSLLVWPRVDAVHACIGSVVYAAGVTAALQHRRHALRCAHSACMHMPTSSPDHAGLPTPRRPALFHLCLSR